MAIKRLWNITCDGFKSSIPTYLISVLCFLFVLKQPAQAQNNPYKIDDACYAYFHKQLSPQLTKPIGIAMCDTFRIMAKTADDKKALCMYYNLKGRAYRYQKKETELRELLKESEVCLKTPYKQYYWATSMLLSSLIEQEHGVDDCLLYLEKMVQKAEMLNDNYGRAAIYRKMGTIYYNYQDHAKALDYLNNAVKAMTADGNTNNIYSLEKEIATCLWAQSFYQEANSMYEASIKHCPTSLKFPIWNSRLINELSRNDVDTLLVNHLYREMEISRKEFKGDMKVYRNGLYNVKCSYFLFKNQLDSAKFYLDLYEKNCKENPTVLSSNIHKSLYYLKKGNADSVYLAMHDYMRFRNAQWKKSNTDAISRMESITGKLRVESQNKQLLIEQLENQHRLLQLQADKNMLKLQNGDLELKQRDALLLARNKEAELNLIEVHKQKDEVRHQKELNNQIEARAKAQQDSARALRLLLFAVSVSAIVIIIILTISYYKINRKRKEAEIARGQAVRADQLKTAFLQNMSHEIRTPLNAIVGFSEVLTSPEMAEMMETEERSEMSKLIQKNSNLLLTLVNDILDLSKLESGTYKMTLSDISVNGLCRDSVKSVEGRKQDGVKLELHLPNEDITLMTDQQRVQQILTNFLTNACKNTSTGKIILGYSSVMISGLPFLRFFVEDTGCGIPKEKIDTIFQRFEKLDSFKQGTGLGLNICQQICKMMKGNIYVDTSYTNGARFVFEHPLSIN